MSLQLQHCYLCRDLRKHQPQRFMQTVGKWS